MMLCVSRTHAPADLPAATRAKPPGWRDPRLWVGVAIVAASVVAGSRIVGAADDSVTVWAAARDLAPGDTVAAGDLAPVRVSFDEAADLGRYLPTGAELPAELHLVRGLGEGELVPVAALGSAADTGTVVLSLAFPPEQVPSGVAAGSHVDVWVVDEHRGAGGTSPVLEDVVVIDAPTVGDSLGSTGGRQLVLGVPEAESDALAEVLEASGDGRVHVLGRG
jgi:hypothetical protein